MTKTVTLWCEAGEHNWERPAQKGQRPKNCPEHQPEKASSGGDGTQAARVARRSQADERIWKAISVRIEMEHCHCGLRPGMTLDDLMPPAMSGTGCNNSFVCPALDAYRRRLGHGGKARQ